MQKRGKCICIRETVDEFYKDRERPTHIYTGNERPTEREWKWNKMLMAKSDAGNELNERHKSQ